MVISQLYNLTLACTEVLVVADNCGVTVPLLEDLVLPPDPALCMHCWFQQPLG
jgi:hypothetical protein